jgi:hypothetical protein
MQASTSTLNYLAVSNDSSSASSASSAGSEDTNQVGVVSRSRRKNRGKNIENAIYAHIRAIRALGRKRINTVEIANALALSVPTVNQAIASLKKKGVKVTNG